MQVNSSLFEGFEFPHHLHRAELDLHLLEKYDTIIGIDEVGRGCLAGPVISAAVILKKEGILLDQLQDSKKLQEKQRKQIFSTIKENSYKIGIGLSTVKEIDSINILQATKLSMYRALFDLGDFSSNSAILVDGLFLPYKKFDSFCLIKGDNRSPSIMAASIIAKVVRDALMKIYDQYYPEFNFASNKGYGTSHHKNILSGSHYTSIHRKSFMPLKNFLK